MKDMFWAIRVRGKNDRFPSIPTDENGHCPVFSTRKKAEKYLKKVTINESNVHIAKVKIINYY